MDYIVLYKATASKFYGWHPLQTAKIVRYVKKTRWVQKKNKMAPFSKVDTIIVVTEINGTKHGNAANKTSIPVFKT